MVPAREARGDGGERRKPPSATGGHQRETPTGIALPEVHLVYERDWLNRKHKFDRYSALEILQDDAANPEELSDASYSFYVNMDNVYFKTEVKSSKFSPEILRARFTYGLVLIGLAVIQADESSPKPSSDDEAEKQSGENGTLPLEERVFQTATAVAPVLLPLIESLGAVTEEQVSIGSRTSDDE